MPSSAQCRRVAFRGDPHDAVAELANRRPRLYPPLSNATEEWQARFASASPKNIFGCLGWLRRLRCRP